MSGHTWINAWEWAEYVNSSMLHDKVVYSFGEINKKSKNVMHFETWTQLGICCCSLDDYNWLWLTKFFSFCCSIYKFLWNSEIGSFYTFMWIPKVKVGLYMTWQQYHKTWQIRLTAVPPQSPVPPQTNGSIPLKALHIRLTAVDITVKKDVLFWQLYFSPELQLLTWFYGMILE